MKYFFTIFFFLYLYDGSSQVSGDAICHVLYVKGEVKKPWDVKLSPRDTLLFKYLKELKFDNETSQVALYQASLGSFYLTKKELKSWSTHESFSEFVQHLLKIKERRVSLSSRGDCTCLTPASCFSTDTLFNDKILLTDSLLFSASEVLQSATKGLYYLQYLNQKRVLKVTNGFVRLAPADFVFRDTSFSSGATPQFIIGIYVVKDQVESNDLVAQVKFNIVSAEDLQQYYRALQNAMQENDTKKLYDAFSQDVYLFFGKPTECQLEKIISSIK